MSVVDPFDLSRRGTSGTLHSGLRAVRAQAATKRWAPALACATSAVLSAPAWSQDRSFTVVPSLSVTQQFTDNRNLSANNPQAESITVLSPGVRMALRSSKVQGAVDYSLNGTYYGRQSGANSLRNALASSLSAEVIDGHAFVNASATISRQSISAFGLQGERPSEINANSVELRSLTISPTLRGRLFGDVEINARLSSSLVSTSNSANNASNSSTATGKSTNQSAGLGLSDNSRAIGWGLDLTRSVADFDGGRKTTQDALRATLSYSPFPELRAFVNAGTERNDVVTTSQQANTTWGGGINWQPTPRTQLGLTGERRFFGNSYSLNFSHRLKRSVVSYADSRSSTQNTAGAGATLTVYDIYFLQFASLEPDPVLRDVLVRSFLRAAGLNPNERLSGGFVSSALSLQQSRNLSMSMQGARNSAVLSVFTTKTRRLDSVSNAPDDLSRVDVLGQSGWSLSLSHRLTPTASAVLSASQQRTAGRGAVAGNGLKSLSASWSNQIARRASLSVTARHSQADGANAYEENSLSASFSLSF